ncbi:PepSY-like domain-containing protein [Flavobacterium sp. NRK1]|uniref:PepSY-like domain-containing protein n=1 Tax=Flavobacterium sp. NRK1 TaxID=2954929 RepID=UPI00209363CD|nr:PepSY-like domain-containing protein [Flavobacterium sp. NRK1]MCO6148506.1 PepSY-like domain-containing protein [Flavobacterium sp. NRK1]
MKTLLSAIALFACTLTMQAQQETVYRSEIPSKARSFLASYFRSPFNHAVRATDDISTIYEIVLNDKTLIQFSEKGIWTLVDGKGKPVPYKFLDKPIVEYIKANHANEAVTRIERCNSECRLALSNGNAVKLKFDAQGTLVVGNY